jgi:NTP pyrophosphatase (non-canonical NTP hydrolase)
MLKTESLAMAKRSATKRDDVIEKLTPQQALAILKRLSENEGEIRDAVHTEARTLLQAVNLDETADEAFFVLDSIDVQDC